MSKKELNSSYISYYAETTGETFGMRLVTLNGKDSRIFYKTDYNTYIPNAINYIIGLLAYHSNRKTKPVDHVFISNNLLSENIGCSYSHASKVMDQIADIFSMDYGLIPGRGRSRKVRITSSLINFFKVFNEEQLELYMMEHNIPEEYHFAMRQIYKYIGWGIAPGQLNSEQQKQRREYLSDIDRKNYLHYAFTSNHKIETRIKYLHEHEELLSELQKRQLSSIEEAHEPGTKLQHYWFRVLIKLQQIVSYILKGRDKENTEQESNTSVTSENQTTGETSEHASATKVAQKKPEDPEDIQVIHQLMGKVLISWNKRSEYLNIPRVARLTETRYNSLMTLIEEYNERELLQALAKLDHLHTGEDYDHKMEFNRFIQSETITYLLEYDSQAEIAEEVSFMESTVRNFNINKLVLTVPTFKNRNELNTWIQQQN